MTDLKEKTDGGPNLLNEERGIPSVNKRKKSGSFNKIVGGAAVAVVAVAMIWMSVKPKGGPKEPTKEESVSQTRRGLPELSVPATAAPPPPAVQAPAAPPPAAAQAAAPARGPGNARPQPTEEELLLARRQRAPIFAVSGNAGGSSGGRSPAGPAYTGDAGMAAPQAAADSDRDGVGANLQGAATQPVSASMLTNRNYLIAKGTFLDCALITAISSQQPGMTSCRLTRNIYSDNGKVLLLERGSIVEGEYRSGQMRQGMDRIFVLWTRVRTPRGVAVQLDSPGADELGRSGLPGWVDTHFWKRFGSTLMLSLVDDVAEYAVQRQRSKSGGDSFTFDSGGDAVSQAAAIALENSINIPPTLNKNQGDLINIYVARDLDFRSVYDLRVN